ncbi:glycine cleavage system aminomethyltransferase GcvT [Coxiella endosymbiont of Amblyomma nuttalli]|uniref:glycine cleavage system aminomethyltransferase GcvT n=1 Tax=Coxiella endosymbiont of Amblyomma nuttalli TaxID=2749996 RepID=UPI001BB7AD5D|nr:glycine cleavage system aminomethyltransferase GcvT [Coxiella endosymbiont of Amblyomma nuttalli]QTS83729.1 glycine cleavage system protein T [Coxiella endosymbiont of Amblyomma nuttalli]
MMLRRTSLYKEHIKAKARFVNFANWEMPLHYGSQITEHHQVRRYVGIFDVSHMGVIDIEGEDAFTFLRYLLANDIAKLKGYACALYTCMLNDNGGIIDDLIVYYIAPHHYRLVLNAGVCHKDFTWIKKQSRSFKVIVNECSQICILAVQGPAIFSLIRAIFNQTTVAALVALKPFQFILSDNLLIARTGYTGENGIEIFVSDEEIGRALWQKFIYHGAKPCGLGARDTLRLEAGFNLYGIDMDETTSPFISNLAWTVSLDDPVRHFIGRAALKKQLNEGIKEQLVGLIMEEPGMLRNQQKVWLANNKYGKVTSGGFSPTLGHAVALARLPIKIESTPYIERRGKYIPIKIVKPPFVR